jgi:hypothetical protein
MARPFPDAEHAGQVGQQPVELPHGRSGLRRPAAPVVLRGVEPALPQRSVEEIHGPLPVGTGSTYVF